jgi:hypothetical protein
MFTHITYQELWAHALMCHIMGCDNSLGLKEFLDQLNLLYIWICIFATDQELWAHELMNRIMGCNHYLGWKDILKFVYCFIILFHTEYIFKYFLLLVPFSHQGNAIMFSF